MFNELSKEEKQAFIDSLDESDMRWLEFLMLDSGGHLGVAMQRLYRLKQSIARGAEGVREEGC